MTINNYYNSEIKMRTLYVSGNRNHLHVLNCNGIFCLSHYSPQGKSKFKEQGPMTFIPHVSMTTTITEKGKKPTYIKHSAFK